MGARWANTVYLRAIVERLEEFGPHGGEKLRRAIEHGLCESVGRNHFRALINVLIEQGFVQERVKLQRHIFTLVKNPFN